MDEGKEAALPKEVSKMTAFIKQEAKEKAHELRIRADEEYAVEKARLMRAEASQLEALLSKRLREGEVRRRVAESSQANKERLRVLGERDGSLQRVFAEARERLCAVGADDKYSKLLENVILEAFEKMNGEAELVVECRPKDAQVINGFSCVKKGSVAIEGKLDDQSAGGVVVRNKSNKIRCDNTLGTRLDLAIEVLLPEIRVQVFGASETRKFFD